MSQSKTFCRDLSQSPDYLALVDALERADGEMALRLYREIGRRMNDFKKGVYDRILSVSAVRGDTSRVYGHAKTDLERFNISFRAESQKYIPGWYRFDTIVKEVSEERRGTR